MRRESFRMFIVSNPNPFQEWNENGNCCGNDISFVKASLQTRLSSGWHTSFYSSICYACFIPRVSRFCLCYSDLSLWIKKKHIYSILSNTVYCVLTWHHYAKAVLLSSWLFWIFNPMSVVLYYLCIICHCVALWDTLLHIQCDIITLLTADFWTKCVKQFLA